MDEKTEGRAQNVRTGLYTNLQQQFNIENMQKFMFTGLLRPFLGHWPDALRRMGIKTDFFAVIPEQFDKRCQAVFLLP